MSVRMTYPGAVAGICALLLIGALQGCDRSNVNEGRRGLPESSRLIESVQGSDLYLEYCATCHGVDGKGGGPTASALNRPVPDLTRIRSRNGGQFPTDRMRSIIAGEDGIAAHGSRQMPVWGPIFKEIEWDKDLSRLCTINLTKHLESLQQP
ncbi:MAG: cytochrome c [Acidobacteria bacterium]|nr:cytochrome c [Acidobacteriota bacterium]